MFTNIHYYKLYGWLLSCAWIFHVVGSGNLDTEQNSVAVSLKGETVCDEEKVSKIWILKKKCNKIVFVNWDFWFSSCLSKRIKKI